MGRIGLCLCRCRRISNAAHPKIMSFILFDHVILSFLNPKTCAIPRHKHASPSAALKARTALPLRKRCTAHRRDGLAHRPAQVPVCLAAVIAVCQLWCLIDSMAEFGSSGGFSRERKVFGSSRSGELGFLPWQIQTMHVRRFSEHVFVHFWLRNTV